MAEAVLFLLFIIPAVLGLAEIIHTVKHYLFAGKRYQGQILLIIADDNSFRLQLENVANQRNWYGNSYPQRILVLPDKLTQENKGLCEKEANRLSLEICEAENLTKILG